MPINYKLKAMEVTSQRKAFCRKRNHESWHVMKEIVDMDVFKTFLNGDTKIMQPIRLTSGHPTRIRKCNQLSHFRCMPPI